MVNMLVKYQCNKCGKVYDDQALADACERDEIPENRYWTTERVMEYLDYDSANY